LQTIQWSSGRLGVSLRNICQHLVANSQEDLLFSAVLQQFLAPQEPDYLK
jgi:hypothetical protein